MKKLVTMLALVLVSTGVFACGGGDDSTTATTASAPDTRITTTTTPTDPADFPIQDDVAGDEHVRYVAEPNGELAYNVGEASTAAGKVEIEFVNSKSVPHNVVVEGPNGKPLAKTKTVKEAITSTTVVLKPGKYVVYCSVPGHRKAGMQGHLTVNPPPLIRR